MKIDDRYIADARERLRKQAQNEATCFSLNDMLRGAQDEVRRLREENERMRLENLALKADTDRINWLADVNNTIGSVVLPREIVEANMASLRQAIDAARGAK